MPQSRGNTAIKSSRPFPTFYTGRPLHDAAAASAAGDTCVVRKNASVRNGEPLAHFPFAYARAATISSLFFFQHRFSWANAVNLGDCWASSLPVSHLLGNRDAPKRASQVRIHQVAFAKIAKMIERTIFEKPVKTGFSLIFVGDFNAR